MNKNQYPGNGTVYIPTPDSPTNPMSVLTLFDADKRSLDYFIDYIVNTIESGSDDPLKVLAISKKMEYITKRVTERIKQNSELEAEKYGDKPFEFMGTEMHYTTTSTRYDFSACGDPKWNEASKIASERESFLKALKGPMTVVIEETGEAVTVNPPRKIQTMGLKTTVK